MSSGPGAPERSAVRWPRWATDEMLGRLTRYLRFVGHDTLYLRGVPDAEIARLAPKEGRRLVTRDRALARVVPDALLLLSPYLADQFQSVVRAAPSASFEIAFVRCTLCNGLLNPELETAGGEVPHSPDRPTWRCSECGHRFWEGSHTASVRARINGWVAKVRS